ncbi:MAG: hypothetical protein ACFHX7_18910 [Pseudomonadota bacterium]
MKEEHSIACSVFRLGQGDSHNQESDVSFGSTGVIVSQFPWMTGVGQKQVLKGHEIGWLALTPVSSLEVSNVFDVCLAANGESFNFEPSNALLNLVRGHDFFNLAT